MEQRITRSTFTGGRANSGDRGLSGEANSDSSLGELHRGVHSLFQGSGVAGKGSIGQSTVAGDRAAAGTPCTCKRRWVRAPVRSSACGGVRSKSLGAL
jgi:hypothetical protein